MERSYDVEIERFEPPRTYTGARFVYLKVIGHPEEIPVDGRERRKLLGQEIIDVSKERFEVLLPLGYDQSRIAEGTRIKNIKAEKLEAVVTRRDLEVMGEGR
ncbi:hypothetical protein COU61_02250 [Candidatus Pacearchaeota archaeon CG10_big_fil_rev_8_21_14_0_10_35_13]|nr:MAG: hypothetical protein COU61_02250 [Candidatus Pacearchaeota archaeon CG10_big_fil_rev_8_21_14_0_10_35_13]